MLSPDPGGGGRCCHLVPGGEVLSPGPRGEEGVVTWSQGGKEVLSPGPGGREVLSRHLWCCTPPSPPLFNRMSDTRL